MVGIDLFRAQRETLRRVVRSDISRTCASKFFTKRITSPLLRIIRYPPENGITGDETVTVVICPEVEKLSFLPGTTSKTSWPNSSYSRLSEFIAVLSPPLFGPYIFAICAMRVMMHVLVACPYEQLKPLCRDRKAQSRRRSRYEFGLWRMHSAPSLNAYPQN